MSYSSQYHGYEIIDGALVMDNELAIEGFIDLQHNDELTSLPEGLSVSSRLELGFCRSLTHLPAGLTVGGYLGLSQCIALTALPDDISVGGSLYLEGTTALASLPKNFSVGAYLYLDDLHIGASDMHIYREFPASVLNSTIGKRVIDVVDHHLLRGTKYADLVIAYIDNNGEFTFENTNAFMT